MSVVDGVFFRRRHEDERALRAFAHEAAYITDIETLLKRTAEIVERHAGASWARFALDGDFAGAGENDAAIVALRGDRNGSPMRYVLRRLRDKYGTLEWRRSAVPRTSLGAEGD